MEAKLAPDIIAWSRSGGVFQFKGTLPELDAVCVVPEYNCIGGKKSVVKATEAHSSFGACVPENRSAIVLVVDGKAHAALINTTKVRFDVLAHGECVSASTAVLRSTGAEGVAPPLASLLEN